MVGDEVSPGGTAGAGLEVGAVQVVVRRSSVQRHFWRAEPTGSYRDTTRGRRPTYAGLPAFINRCVSGDVMKNLFSRFVNEEAGQDLIEYALLAGLISLVCVVAITSAGTKVSGLFNKVTTAIP